MSTITRRLAAALAEMRYAERRVAARRTATDPYLPHPDEAPDTYSEFLARTSGFLLHEPPARSREQGHRVG
jgi:hypothetical protein